MNIDFDTLNEGQKEAVETIKGPVCVIAGAGSGKTKALTARIANMLQKGIAPENILAITFTNKAAREMKERVANIVGDTEVFSKLSISTYHSFCSRLLRQNVYEAEHLSKGFAIVDSDDKMALIRQALKALDIDTEKYRPNAVANFISDKKNHLIHWNEVGKLPYAKQAYGRIYEYYQKNLALCNRCDFDDLLMFAVDLLKDDNGVLKDLNNKFHYILVDEYQDTNPAQYALTTLLAGERRNLFVVGDVDQAIYGFRGSDFTNILNFQKEYPEAKLIRLEQNYRSTNTILEAANAVIENNKERIPKTLWTRQEETSPIIVHHAINGRREVEWVCQKICKEIQEYGRSYSDIAILVRANSLTYEFEMEFIKRNMPYVVVGAYRFYDRKEIKDALAYFQLFLNPADAVSFARIANYPKRGIGSKSIEKILTECRERNMNILQRIKAMNEDGTLSVILAKKGAREALLEFCEKIQTFPEDKNMSLANRMYAFLEQFGFISSYDSEDVPTEDKEIYQTKKQNVLTFLTAAMTFEKDGQGNTLEEFLDYIALLSDADAWEEKENRVTIMTCHASKGLEFPVVFLVAFEEDVFPSYFAIRDAKFGNPLAIEEERRLCYVALTRPKKHLYISSARKRMLYGQERFGIAPSRFLQEIPQRLLQED